MWDILQCVFIILFVLGRKFLRVRLYRILLVLYCVYFLYDQDFYDRQFSVFVENGFFFLNNISLFSFYCIWKKIIFIICLVLVCLIYYYFLSVQLKVIQGYRIGFLFYLVVMQVGCIERKYRIGCGVFIFFCSFEFIIQYYL